MNPQLAQFIEQKSAELYPKEVWEPLYAKHESIGLCTELYDLRCEVMEACFEERPELFEGIKWVNDDNGMPLWVRPGVEWSVDDDNY